VKAEVGQQVKAGDVLAKASTTDLKSQLGQARTSLQAAQIQEKAANKSLNDAIANSSGTAAIRQAKTAWLSAVNARRQAQSQVYTLEDQIRFATLKAPVDGIVTAVNIVKGLDSTGTAITLDSAGYQVTADVVETDVSSMTVGQDATVSVGAIDATIQGKVSAIAPTGTASSNGVVQYPVTVTLTGAPKALRNGMTADITIVTAAANNVLTIPSAALRGTNGNYSVQVLGADGKPTLTPVTVGLVTNTTAEIKSGLTEGAQVVTGTTSDRIASSTTNSNNGFGGGGRFGNGGVFVGGPGVNVKGP
jgi:RND family efflux transporter MFP subunit